MIRSTERPINDGQSNVQHKEVAGAEQLVPNVSVDELRRSTGLGGEGLSQCELLIKLKTVHLLADARERPPPTLENQCLLSPVHFTIPC